MSFQVYVADVAYVGMREKHSLVSCSSDLVLCMGIKSIKSTIITEKASKFSAARQIFAYGVVSEKGSGTPPGSP